MDPQGREGDPQGIDEVARQRTKQRAARLNEPVPGFPALTLGELVDQVRSGSDGPGSAEGVTELLRSGGHGHDTIESVLRCLDLDPPGAPPPDGEVYTAIDASRGRQRLRTLAQLEALLLKD